MPKPESSSILLPKIKPLKVSFSSGVQKDDFESEERVEFYANLSTQIIQYISELSSYPGISFPMAEFPRSQMGLSQMVTDWIDTSEADKLLEFGIIPLYSGGAHLTSVRQFFSEDILDSKAIPIIAAAVRDFYRKDIVESLWLQHLMVVDTETLSDSQGGRFQPFQYITAKFLPLTNLQRTDFNRVLEMGSMAVWLRKMVDSVLAKISYRR